MITINYTGKNYKECLDITSKTWINPIILTDTPEFGEQFFENESTDFNTSCRRKILAIKEGLKRSKDLEDKRVIYFDADIYLVDKNLDECFKNDLTVTRMIRRNRPYQEINAGVSYWIASDKTITLCDEWLKLEEEYRKDPSIPYPEQRALNDLAVKGYDGIGESRVGNISENLYNFERDDDRQFITDLETYKPKVIHLKGKKWQNKFIMDYLNKYLTKS